MDDKKLNDIMGELQKLVRRWNVLSLQVQEVQESLNVFLTRITPVLQEEKMKNSANRKAEEEKTKDSTNKTVEPPPSPA
jgi:hypothetical protein